MLDLKFIIQNMELVIQKLQTRQEDFSYLEELILLNQSRKNLIVSIEQMRFKKNNLSRSIGILKRENKSIDEEVIAKEAISKKELEALTQELQTIENKINHLLHIVPNIPHESTPIGQSEEDNVVIKHFMKPEEQPFPIKDHVEIGEKLNILDLKAAAKVTGSRFAVLKGAGARLERALINFMMDTNSQKGYQEIIPPFIVNENSMFSTGQLPKFEKELFKLKLDKYNWYLNPTAEVPTINIHRNETLKAERLPIKYVSFTTCFRQEAGAAGKDTRGILRQKQFNKVELIQFVEPQNSYTVLEEMLKDSEEILQKLKIPYRVVALSTGDLGFSMTKTYDIEVWLPSQQKYREIASISNAETFQARRANIKFNKNKKDKNEYVHTLNGSALAIGRTMIAIMENYQNKDGNIVVPDVLKSYMGIDIIK
ncbi:MAG: serine--tRNA ligase [Candidatus Phytoplasma pruni]|uniref:serine--tRNA ligase n=1 Tax=Milkweed yellows phytoplasma TaxID=208434 RepID=UPI0003627F50|nr:serine--tRNA ligase [Milkweed yellows phytoplasma]